MDGRMPAAMLRAQIEAIAREFFAVDGDAPATATVTLPPGVPPGRGAPSLRGSLGFSWDRLAAEGRVGHGDRPFARGGGERGEDSVSGGMPWSPAGCATEPIASSADVMHTVLHADVAAMSLPLRSPSALYASVELDEELDGLVGAAAGAPLADDRARAGCGETTSGLEGGESVPLGARPTAGGSGAQLPVEEGAPSLRSVLVSLVTGRRKGPSHSTPLMEGGGAETATQTRPASPTPAAAIHGPSRPHPSPGGGTQGVPPPPPYARWNDEGHPELWREASVAAEGLGDDTSVASYSPPPADMGGSPYARGERERLRRDSANAAAPGDSHAYATMGRGRERLPTHRGLHQDSLGDFAEPFPPMPTMPLSSSNYYCMPPLLQYFANGPLDPEDASSWQTSHLVLLPQFVDGMGRSSGSPSKQSSGPSDGAMGESAEQHAWRDYVLLAGGRDTGFHGGGPASRRFAHGGWAGLPPSPSEAGYGRTALPRGCHVVTMAAADPRLGRVPQGRDDGACDLQDSLRVQPMWELYRRDRPRPDGANTQDGMCIGTAVVPDVYANYSQPPLSWSNQCTRQLPSSFQHGLQALRSLATGAVADPRGGAAGGRVACGLSQRDAFADVGIRVWDGPDSSGSPGGLGGIRRMDSGSAQLATYPAPVGAAGAVPSPLPAAAPVALGITEAGEGAVMHALNAMLRALLQSEEYRLVLSVVLVVSGWEALQRDLRVIFLFRYIRACLPTNSLSQATLAMEAWGALHNIKASPVVYQKVAADLLRYSCEWLQVESPRGLYLTGLVVVKHLLVWREVHYDALVHKMLWPILQGVLVPLFTDACGNIRELAAATLESVFHVMLEGGRRDLARPVMEAAVSILASETAVVLADGAACDDGDGDQDARGARRGGLPPLQHKGSMASTVDTVKNRSPPILGHLPQLGAPVPLAEARDRRRLGADAPSGSDDAAAPLVGEPDVVEPRPPSVSQLLGPTDAVPCPRLSPQNFPVDSLPAMRFHRKRKHLLYRFGRLFSEVSASLAPRKCEPPRTGSHLGGHPSLQLETPESAAASRRGASSRGGPVNAPTVVAESTAAVETHGAAVSSDGRFSERQRQGGRCEHKESEDPRGLGMSHRSLHSLGRLAASHIFPARGTGDCSTGKVHSDAGASTNAASARSTSSGSAPATAVEQWMVLLTHCSLGMQRDEVPLHAATLVIGSFVCALRSLKPMWGGVELRGDGGCSSPRRVQGESAKQPGGGAAACSTTLLAASRMGISTWSTPSRLAVPYPTPSLSSSRLGREERMGQSSTDRPLDLGVSTRAVTPSLAVTPMDLEDTAKLRSGVGGAYATSQVPHDSNWAGQSMPVLPTFGSALGGCPEGLPPRSRPTGVPVAADPTSSLALSIFSEEMFDVACRACLADERPGACTALHRLLPLLSLYAPQLFEPFAIRSVRQLVARATSLTSGVFAAPRRGAAGEPAAVGCGGGGGGAAGDRSAASEVHEDEVAPCHHCADVASSSSRALVTLNRQRSFAVINMGLLLATLRLAPQYEAILADDVLPLLSKAIDMGLSCFVRSAFPTVALLAQNLPSPRAQKRFSLAIMNLTRVALKSCFSIELTRVAARVCEVYPELRPVCHTALLQRMSDVLSNDLDDCGGEETMLGPSPQRPLDRSSSNVEHDERFRRGGVAPNVPILGGVGMRPPPAGTGHHQQRAVLLLERKRLCFRMLQSLCMSSEGTATFFWRVCLPYLYHPNASLRRECVQACVSFLLSDCFRASHPGGTVAHVAMCKPGRQKPQHSAQPRDFTTQRPNQLPLAYGEPPAALLRRLSAVAVRPGESMTAEERQRGMYRSSRKGAGLTGVETIHHHGVAPGGYSTSLLAVNCSVHAGRTHISTLREVIHRLVHVAIADPEASIRYTALMTLGPEVDQFLFPHEDILQCLFDILEDEYIPNRIAAMRVLRRLAIRNESLVFPQLHKVFLRSLGDALRLPDPAMLVEDGRMQFLFECLLSVPQGAYLYTDCLLEVLRNALMLPNASSGSIIASLRMLSHLMDESTQDEWPAFYGFVDLIATQMLERRDDLSRILTALGALQTIVQYMASSTASELAVYTDIQALATRLHSLLYQKPSVNTEVSLAVLKLLGTISAVEPHNDDEVDQAATFIGQRPRSPQGESRLPIRSAPLGGQRQQRLRATGRDCFQSQPQLFPPQSPLRPRNTWYDFFGWGGGSDQRRSIAMPVSLEESCFLSSRTAFDESNWPHVVIDVLLHSLTDYLREVLTYSEDDQRLCVGIIFTIIEGTETPVYLGWYVPALVAILGELLLRQQNSDSLRVATLGWTAQLVRRAGRIVAPLYTVFLDFIHLSYFNGSPAVVMAICDLIAALAEVVPDFVRQDCSWIVTALLGVVQARREAIALVLLPFAMLPAVISPSIEPREAGRGEAETHPFFDPCGMPMGTASMVAPPLDEPQAEEVPLVVIPEARLADGRACVTSLNASPEALGVMKHVLATLRFLLPTMSPMMADVIVDTLASLCSSPAAEIATSSPRGPSATPPPASESVTGHVSGVERHMAGAVPLSAAAVTGRIPDDGHAAADDVEVVRSDVAQLLVECMLRFDLRARVGVIVDSCLVALRTCYLAPLLELQYAAQELGRLASESSTGRAAETRSRMQLLRNFVGLRRRHCQQVALAGRTHSVLARLRVDGVDAHGEPISVAFPFTHRVACRKPRPEKDVPSGETVGRGGRSWMRVLTEGQRSPSGFRRWRSAAMKTTPEATVAPPGEPCLSEAELPEDSYDAAVLWSSITEMNLLACLLVVSTYFEPSVAAVEGQAQTVSPFVDVVRAYLSQRFGPTSEVIGFFELCWRCQSRGIAVRAPTTLLPPEVPLKRCAGGFVRHGRLALYRPEPLEGAFALEGSSSETKRPKRRRTAMEPSADGCLPGATAVNREVTGSAGRGEHHEHTSPSRDSGLGRTGAPVQRSSHADAGRGTHSSLLEGDAGVRHTEVALTERISLESVPPLTQGPDGEGPKLRTHDAAPGPGVREGAGVPVGAGAGRTLSLTRAASPTPASGEPNLSLSSLSVSQTMLLQSSALPCIQSSNSLITMLAATSVAASPSSVVTVGGTGPSSFVGGVGSAMAKAEASRPVLTSPPIPIISSVRGQLTSADAVLCSEAVMAEASQTTSNTHRSMTDSLIASPSTTTTVQCQSTVFDPSSLIPSSAALRRGQFDGSRAEGNMGCAPRRGNLERNADSVGDKSFSISSVAAAPMKSKASLHPERLQESSFDDSVSSNSDSKGRIGADGGDSNGLLACEGEYSGETGPGGSPGCSGAVNWNFEQPLLSFGVAAEQISGEEPPRDQEGLNQLQAFFQDQMRSRKPQNWLSWFEQLGLMLLESSPHFYVSACAPLIRRHFSVMCSGIFPVAFLSHLTTCRSRDERHAESRPWARRRNAARGSSSEDESSSDSYHGMPTEGHAASGRGGPVPYSSRQRAARGLHVADSRLAPHGRRLARRRSAQRRGRRVGEVERWMMLLREYDGSSERVPHLVAMEMSRLVHYIRLYAPSMFPKPETLIMIQKFISDDYVLLLGARALNTPLASMYAEMCIARLVGPISLRDRRTSVEVPAPRDHAEDDTARETRWLTAIKLMDAIHEADAPQDVKVGLRRLIREALGGDGEGAAPSALLRRVEVGPEGGQRAAHPAQPMPCFGRPGVEDSIGAWLCARALEFVGDYNAALRLYQRQIQEVISAGRLMLEETLRGAGAVPWGSQASPHGEVHVPLGTTTADEGYVLPPATHMMGERSWSGTATVVRVEKVVVSAGPAVVPSVADASEGPVEHVPTEPRFTEPPAEAALPQLGSPCLAPCATLPQSLSPLLDGASSRRRVKVPTGSSRSHHEALPLHVRNVVGALRCYLKVLDLESALAVWEAVRRLPFAVEDTAGGGAVAFGSDSERPQGTGCTATPSLSGATWPVSPCAAAGMGTPDAKQSDHVRRACHIAGSALTSPIQPYLLPQSAVSPLSRKASAASLLSATAGAGGAAPPRECAASYIKGNRILAAAVAHGEQVLLCSPVLGPKAAAAAAAEGPPVAAPVSRASGEAALLRSPDTAPVRLGRSVQLVPEWPAPCDSGRERASSWAAPPLLSPDISAVSHGLPGTEEGLQAFSPFATSVPLIVAQYAGIAAATLSLWDVVLDVTNYVSAAQLVVYLAPAAQAGDVTQQTDNPRGSSSQHGEASASSGGSVSLPNTAHVAPLSGSAPHGEGNTGSEPLSNDVQRAPARELPPRPRLGPGALSPFLPWGSHSVTGELRALDIPSPTQPQPESKAMATIRRQQVQRASHQPESALRSPPSVAQQCAFTRAVRNRTISSFESQGVGSGVPTFAERVNAPTSPTSIVGSSVFPLPSFCPYLMMMTTAATPGPTADATGSWSRGAGEGRHLYDATGSLLSADEGERLGEGGVGGLSIHYLRAAPLRQASSSLGRQLDVFRAAALVASGQYEAAQATLTSVRGALRDMNTFFHSEDFRVKLQLQIIFQQISDLEEGIHAIQQQQDRAGGLLAARHAQLRQGEASPAAAAAARVVAGVENVLGFVPEMASQECLPGSKAGCVGTARRLPLPPVAATLVWDDSTQRRLLNIAGRLLPMRCTVLQRLQTIAVRGALVSPDKQLHNIFLMSERLAQREMRPKRAAALLDYFAALPLGVVDEAAQQSYRSVLFLERVRYELRTASSYRRLHRLHSDISLWLEEAFRHKGMDASGAGAAVPRGTEAQASHPVAGAKGEQQHHRHAQVPSVPLPSVPITESEAELIVLQLECRRKVNRISLISGGHVAGAGRRAEPQRRVSVPTEELAAKSPQGDVTASLHPCDTDTQAEDERSASQGDLAFSAPPSTGSEAPPPLGTASTAARWKSRRSEKRPPTMLPMDISGVYAVDELTRLELFSSPLSPRGGRRLAFPSSPWRKARPSTVPGSPTTGGAGERADATVPAETLSGGVDDGCPEAPQVVADVAATFTQPAQTSQGGPQQRSHDCGGVNVVNPADGPGTSTVKPPVLPPLTSVAESPADRLLEEYRVAEHLVGYSSHIVASVWREFGLLLFDVCLAIYAEWEETRDGETLDNFYVQAEKAISALQRAALSWASATSSAIGGVGPFATAAKRRVQNARTHLPATHLMLKALSLAAMLEGRRTRCAEPEGFSPQSSQLQDRQQPPCRPRQYREARMNAPLSQDTEGGDRGGFSQLDFSSGTFVFWAGVAPFLVNYAVRHKYIHDTLLEMCQKSLPMLHQFVFLLIANFEPRSRVRPLLAVGSGVCANAATQDQGCDGTLRKRPSNLARAYARADLAATSGRVDGPAAPSTAPRARRSRNSKASTTAEAGARRCGCASDTCATEDPRPGPSFHVDCSSQMHVPLSPAGTAEPDRGGTTRVPAGSDAPTHSAAFPELPHPSGPTQSRRGGRTALEPGRCLTVPPEKATGQAEHFSCRPSCAGTSTCCRKAHGRSSMLAPELYVDESLQPHALPPAQPGLPTTATLGADRQPRLSSLRPGETEEEPKSDPPSCGRSKNRRHVEQRCHPEATMQAFLENVFTAVEMHAGAQAAASAFVFLPPSADPVTPQSTILQKIAKVSPHHRTMVLSALQLTEFIASGKGDEVSSTLCPLPAPAWLLGKLFSAPATAGTWPSQGLSSHATASGDIPVALNQLFGLDEERAEVPGNGPDINANGALGGVALDPQTTRQYCQPAGEPPRFPGVTVSASHRGAAYRMPVRTRNEGSPGSKVPFIRSARQTLDDIVDEAMSQRRWSDEKQRSCRLRDGGLGSKRSQRSNAASSPSVLTVGLPSGHLTIFGVRRSAVQVPTPPYVREEVVTLMLSDGCQRRFLYAVTQASRRTIDASLRTAFVRETHVAEWGDVEASGTRRAESSCGGNCGPEARTVQPKSRRSVHQQEPTPVAVPGRSSPADPLPDGAQATIDLELSNYSQGDEMNGLAPITVPLPASVDTGGGYGGSPIIIRSRGRGSLAGDETRGELGAAGRSEAPLTGCAEEEPLLGKADGLDRAPHSTHLGATCRREARARHITHGRGPHRVLHSQAAHAGSDGVAQVYFPLPVATMESAMATLLEQLPLRHTRRPLVIPVDFGTYLVQLPDRTTHYRVADRNRPHSLAVHGSASSMHSTRNTRASSSPVATDASDGAMTGTGATGRLQVGHHRSALVAAMKSSSAMLKVGDDAGTLLFQSQHPPTSLYCIVREYSQKSFSQWIAETVAVRLQALNASRRRCAMQQPHMPEDRAWGAEPGTSSPTSHCEGRVNVLQDTYQGDKESEHLSEDPRGPPRRTRPSMVLDDGACEPPKVRAAAVPKAAAGPSAVFGVAVASTSAMLLDRTPAGTPLSLTPPSSSCPLARAQSVSATPEFDSGKRSAHGGTSIVDDAPNPRGAAALHQKPGDCVHRSTEQSSRSFSYAAIVARGHRNHRRLQMLLAEAFDEGRIDRLSNFLRQITLQSGGSSSAGEEVDPRLFSVPGELPALEELLHQLEDAAVGVTGVAGQPRAKPAAATSSDASNSQGPPPPAGGVACERQVATAARAIEIRAALHAVERLRRWRQLPFETVPQLKEPRKSSHFSGEGHRMTTHGKSEASKATCHRYALGSTFPKSISGGSLSNHSITSCSSQALPGHGVDAVPHGSEVVGMARRTPGNASTVEANPALWTTFLEKVRLSILRFEAPRFTLALRHTIESGAANPSQWLEMRHHVTQELAEWSVLQYLFGITERVAASFFVDLPSGHIVWSHLGENSLRAARVRSGTALSPPEPSPFLPSVGSPCGTARLLRLSQGCTVLPSTWQDEQEAAAAEVQPRGSDRSGDRSQRYLSPSASPTAVASPTMVPATPVERNASAVLALRFPTSSELGTDVPHRRRSIRASPLDTMHDAVGPPVSSTSRPLPVWEAAAAAAPEECQRQADADVPIGPGETVGLSPMSRPLPHPEPHARPVMTQSPFPCFDPTCFRLTTCLVAALPMGNPFGAFQFHATRTLHVLLGFQRELAGIATFGLQNISCNAYRLPPGLPYATSSPPPPTHPHAAAQPLVGGSSRVSVLHAEHGWPTHNAEVTLETDRSAPQSEGQAGPAKVQGLPPQGGTSAARPPAAEGAGGYCGKASPTGTTCESVDLVKALKSPIASHRSSSSSSSDSVITTATECRRPPSRAMESWFGVQRQLPEGDGCVTKERATANHRLHHPTSQEKHFFSENMFHPISAAALASTVEATADILPAGDAMGTCTDLQLTTPGPESVEDRCRTRMERDRCLLQALSCFESRSLLVKLMDDLQPLRENLTTPFRETNSDGISAKHCGPEDSESGESGGDEWDSENQHHPTSRADHHRAPPSGSPKGRDVLCIMGARTVEGRVAQLIAAATDETLIIGTAHTPHCWHVWAPQW